LLIRGQGGCRKHPEAKLAQHRGQHIRLDCEAGGQAGGQRGRPSTRPITKFARDLLGYI
jgi:hypothetical protein